MFSPFIVEWLQLRYPRENLESLTKEILAERLSNKARRREGLHPVGSCGYMGWIKPLLDVR